MSKPLPDFCFKPLKEDEQILYRDWARKHYNPGDEIKGVWHPIVRAECERMNVEQWERSQCR